MDGQTDGKNKGYVGDLDTRWILVHAAMMTHSLFQKIKWPLVNPRSWMPRNIPKKQ